LRLPIALSELNRQCLRGCVCQRERGLFIPPPQSELKIPHGRIVHGRESPFEGAFMHASKTQQRLPINYSDTHKKRRIGSEF